MKRQSQKKEVSVKLRPDYEAIAEWAKMAQKLAVKLQKEAEKPKPDINKCAIHNQYTDSTAYMSDKQIYPAHS